VEAVSEHDGVKPQVGTGRIREVFEYAASGMAITDLAGRFQETNTAYRAVVARTQQQLQRETILSITHEEDRPNCRGNLELLISGKIPSFVLQKRYVRPDGESVWVRNSFSLLKDPDGAPAQIILICNDITEQRHAEQLLVQSEKIAVVGRLASSIAHEINNPLESVLNLLFLVRESRTLEQAQKFAAQAEEEVQSAAHIATQTLQFHRQQSRPMSTELEQLLMSVLGLFKGKLNQNQIEVKIEKTEQTRLFCYASEIRQVLANLIRNAIEAMPSGGRLRLRIRPATDWRTNSPAIRLTVADSGSGMSPQTLRQIYEPFFSTKGNFGTGLGLWVSLGILQKHQARMRLRSSDAPGTSGTVFMLIFPTNGVQAG
jgi:PAS domain S-box-containing protein